MLTTKHNTQNKQKYNFLKVLFFFLETYKWTLHSKKKIICVKNGIIIIFC